MSPVETLPGLTLAFVLGLRHGLAPDHLAAIDGLTIRALQAGPRWAPWMGVLFACGHAMVALLIVLAAALSSSWLDRYDALLAWLEWLPPVFLLSLAVLNLRQLLRPGPGGTLGLARPGTLRGAGPAAAVGVGMVFALGVESVLQALAWGVAGAAFGGIEAALAVAAAFACGMALTDGLDGWVAARIVQRGDPARVAGLRRMLAWPVTALCLLTGAAMLAEKACGSCQLDHTLALQAGAALLAATVALYGVALLRR